MNYYAENKDAVLKELKTAEAGLDNEEAAARLLKNGPNKLAEPKKTPLIVKFLKQFANPMIIVLLAAAAVSAITSIIAKESPTDVVIILAVVLLNAVLGLVQESKAEKAIDALKSMTPAMSKVIRGGELRIIKSEELIVGDIVALEAGDAVPADGRLTEAASLKTDESALTGESVPAEKTTAEVGQNASLGDRRSMVYMGGTAVYGRGRFAVTAVGMDTEMGKIADAISAADEGQTPLQKKLSSLSKVLTYLVLGVCVFIFAFTLLKNRDFSSKTILNTFMIAVSLAVAAIPEGLAAVVTIVLSIGVTKMAAHNAIIRRLTAVETLGCTSVICSDKTGTLTQNRMTVVKSWGDKERTAAAMALCSDAELGEGGKANGEPTECALVEFAAKCGLPKGELKAENPKIGEAPFDSERKMMSTVHRRADGGIVQYTKGAPDELIKRCDKIYKNSAVLPLTDEDKRAILAYNKSCADEALRVLAAAEKRLSSEPESYAPEALEQGLVFLGLVGMIDPIRPEVADAVAKCRAAGIRPIMITGDHRDTAAAIAKQLGIITSGDQAISGSALDGMSDAELDSCIENYSVYARVQPEHKVRIVNSWRRRGAVTAMTGDGVNDAPAIKCADIGVGMGITGTDVTKSVADMVLADDNFATIVAAVEEGRRIYDNIRKSIQFLLSSNLSEVLTIFTATILGFTILSPIHILWINLITDSVPALALGMERAEPDVMKRPPRSAKEGIFAGGAGRAIAIQGIFVAALTLAAYFVGHRFESGVWEIAQSPDGMTLAFLTLSLTEVLHSFNMRSLHGSIFTLKYHNLWLYSGMAASIALTAAVIYVPPLRAAFGLEFISFTEYLIALAIAVMIIPLVEAEKLIERAAAGRHSASEQTSEDEKNKKHGKKAK